MGRCWRNMSRQSDNFKPSSSRERAAPPASDSISPTENTRLVYTDHLLRREAFVHTSITVNHRPALRSPQLPPWPRKNGSRDMTLPADRTRTFDQPLTPVTLQWWRRRLRRVYLADDNAPTAGSYWKSVAVSTVTITRYLR